MKNLRIQKYAPIALMLCLAVAASAQDMFVDGSAAARTSALATGRNVAVIIAVVLGLSFAVDHQHGVTSRIISMVVCLTIALGAQVLISTLQSWN